MHTTITDIAKKAKVSTMTVSRVLSKSGPVAPKTAERIKKAMKELNYRPNLIARSLSSKRTMTIGVVIPKTQKIFLDNYIAQVLSGISDVAQANDYRIMTIPTNRSDKEEDSYLNYARSKLFDGMILLKTKINDPHLLELSKSGFPYMLVNYREYANDYNFVDTKNIRGTELAINHLYNKGHKKIAFVAGSMDETNAKDRLTGYKKSLKKFNLAFKDDYIIYGEFNKDIAYERSEKLLKLKDRPTAIFCSDDYMALGVIQRIKNLGLKVPKDIAVIGFDNIEIGEFTRPALTTVKQPMYETGECSVEGLLSLITKKDKVPVRIMLNTELIIRESA